MNESRIAYPYAKSLYLLTQEQGKTDTVLNDMKLISSVCAQNPDLINVLKSPIIPVDKKNSIIDTIFKGRVDDLTFQFYKILRNKNREQFLYDIAKEYVNIYKKDKGIISATITSAAPINENLLGSFKKLIAANFQSNDVEINLQVKPEIIGGYILTVGDKQIDQSIEGKINALKNKFKHNPYISKL